MRLINARNQLRSYNVALFPKMKTKDQQEQHKAIHKEAYPELYAVTPIMTREEASKMLGGLNGR